MNRFTGRRWLPLLVLAALLGCQSEEARLAEHLRRAEKYLEEEKASEAIIEYRNALRIAPNDADAHYGLAKAYLAAEEPAKAYWELQETVRLDPSNLEARLEYARFLLVGREDELNQAIEQADAVLAEDPKNARAHAVKARALERLDRLDDARREYETAVALAPDSAEYLRALAGFHVRRGERPEAEALLRRLTEAEPSFRSWASLAAFLSRDPERDREAEAAYRRALELATEDEKSLAYRFFASFYFARERYDDAERVLREGLEATGNDLEVIYTLARFYHARGEKQKADEMMEAATRSRPDEVEPYVALSLYRGRNGDPEGALEAVEAALRVDPDNRQARLRKAELLIEMGFEKEDPALRAEGQKIVREVLEKDPSSPEANFVKAKLDLAEGRVEEAVSALRRTTDGRPDWAQAHFLLASALLLQGDRQEARAEALRALELDAQLLEARRLLARIYAGTGEHQLAAEEAQKLLRQAPGDVQTRVLLAQSLVRLGRIDAALAELEKLPPDAGGEASYARARILMLKGDLPGAREALMQALASKPHHPDILESLLQLDAREGRLEESLERIREAQAHSPESPRLARLYATALLLAGRSDEAEKMLRRAVELDPKDLASYQALARFLVATGRQQESIATFEKALAAQPGSAHIHLQVGSLYELSGDVERAIQHYEQAVRLDPSLAEAKNNLAYLMAERGENLDRALDLAQEAKAMLPDNPMVADTLGWVLYKKGIASAAVNYLKEAEAGIPPDRPELGVVRHHLALAYVADGQPEKAREVLERALSDLEGQRRLARERGVKEPPEPAWARDARTLLEKLGSEPAAAAAGP